MADMPESMSLAKLRESLASQGLATAVKPNAGQGALEDGDYTLKITHYQETHSSEQSANPGALLYKVGFKVASGSRKGSTTWLNNSVTEERYVPAWGLMTGLFVACGVPESEINDPDFAPNDEWGKRNVVGKLVDAEVFFSPGRNGFRDGNGFRKFTPHEMTTDDLLSA